MTLRNGETVDVYRYYYYSMGQTSPESLPKCAIVAGLPADVANQLKATAAVQEMSLNEIVTRTRPVLSTASNASTAYICFIARQPVTINKTVRCYNCSVMDMFLEDTLLEDKR